MTSPTSPRIHIVGYGGQARAWAQCLRESGWSVEIYLRTPAKLSGSRPLAALASELEAGARVALLCADSAIGEVYERHLRGVDRALHLVIAHGFSVYAGTLKNLEPEHSLSLLAPKAIGPQIVTHFQAGRPHELRAAWYSPAVAARAVIELAQGMGFSERNLISTTFEKETIGDLISEQGLLCGGLFTLLDWTQSAMREAGVPEDLIREECLSELELVAGLLKRKGPAETFATISDAAKVGALLVRDDFDRSDLRPRLQARFGEILSGKFGQRFLNQDWQGPIATEISRLKTTNPVNPS
jgi:ketol-acid reductoisomerase